MTDVSIFRVMQPYDWKFVVGGLAVEILYTLFTERVGFPFLRK